MIKSLVWKKNIVIIILVLAFFTVNMCGCLENQGNEEPAAGEEAFDNESTETEEPDDFSGKLDDAPEEQDDPSEAKLNFDGLYCYINDFDNDGLINNDVLRFYEDGDVINVSFVQAEKDQSYFPSEQSFSKDVEDIGRYIFIGQYLINGTDISFTTSSYEYGSIDYWGTIKSNKLLLSSHSNINGHDAYREYIFYPFSEISD